MATVVDCSALVKLVLDEPGAVEFSRWWSLNHATRKVAPTLLYYEVGRALQKAGRPTREAAVDQEELLSAIDLVGPQGRAKKDWISEGLAFYDACYLALALEIGQLVTADGKLAAAARRQGIRVVLIPSA